MDLNKSNLTLKSEKLVMYKGEFHILTVLNDGRNDFDIYKPFDISSAMKNLDISEWHRLVDYFLEDLFDEIKEDIEEGNINSFYKNFTNLERLFVTLNQYESKDGPTIG